MQLAARNRTARLALGVPLALILGLGACADSATGVGPAWQQVTVEIPSAMLPNVQPCTGRALTFEPSRTRIAYRAAEDRHGALHITYHLIQLLTGKDARSNEYQAARDIFNATLLTRHPDQIVVSEVHNVGMVTRGPAPNFRLHITYRLRVNRNSSTGDAELAAEVAGVESSCDE